MREPEFLEELKFTSIWPYSVPVVNCKNYGRALDWCYANLDKSVWRDLSGGRTFVFIFSTSMDAMRFKFEGF